MASLGGYTVRASPVSTKPGTAALIPKQPAPAPAPAASAYSAPAAPAPAPTTTMTAPAVARPAYQLMDYKVNEQAAPELVAARQRAEKYLGELESGSGYATEVMQGKMQSQIDADVKRAREAAAAQGMPFDEAAFRRDAMAKMQGALAEEKLGREKLRGEQMAGLLPTIGAGESSRMARSEFELGRQRGGTADALSRYGLEAGMYGTDVGAATSIYSTNKQTEVAAMNALNNFLSSAFNFSFA